MKTTIQNSLTIKLLKIVFLVYTVITLITLSLQLYFQYNSTLEKINHEVVSIEQKFSEPLSAAVWNFSVEEISSILEGINTNQFVSGVSLVDTHNNTVQEKGFVKSKEYLKYNFEIKRNYKGKEYLLGKIKIYSKPNIIYTEFKDNVFFTITNTLVVFLSLSIVLIIISYNYLSKPLAELREYLESINIDNLEECKLLEKNFVLDNDKKDELEMFKTSLVVMVKKILDSTKELSLMNISLEKKVEERTIELKKLTMTDYLTSLANRNKLDETIEKEIMRANRYNTSFGVIMVDIDHFKSTNDIYGHLVGDQVLIEIATILKQSIRDCDVAGRWGGEEFLIVCAETDSDGLYSTADHLRKKIESFNFSHVKQKTASFGIASFESSDTFDSLIARADKALYTSKNNGRNQVSR